MNILNNIKLIGISRAEIIEKCNISYPTLLNAEKGIYTQKTFNKINSVLEPIYKKYIESKESQCFFVKNGQLVSKLKYFNFTLLNGNIIISTNYQVINLSELNKEIELINETFKKM